MNGLIEIPVGRSDVALVDESDSNLVSPLVWHLKRSKHCAYAYCLQSVEGDPKAILMHRLLMDPAPGMFVDHIDGNGLNNRRSNLRVCTMTENNRNRIHRKPDAKRRFKGVFKFRQQNKGGIYVRYYGRISIGGKQLVSPVVVTEEEAAKGYDELARLHFGEFAALNFPKDIR